MSRPFFSVAIRCNGGLQPLASAQNKSPRLRAAEVPGRCGDEPAPRTGPRDGSARYAGPVAGSFRSQPGRLATASTPVATGMPGPRSADPLPLRSVPNVSALRSSGTAPLTARFGHLRPPRLRSGRSTPLHSILPLRSVPTPIATTWEPTPASHGLGPAPLRFLRSSLRQTALQDRCGETPPAGGRSSRTLRRRTWSGTGDNSTPDPDQPTTGHLLIYTKPKRTSSRWPDRCGGTPPAGGRSSRTLRRDPACGRQEKRGHRRSVRPHPNGLRARAFAATGKGDNLTSPEQPPVSPPSV